MCPDGSAARPKVAWERVRRYDCESSRERINRIHRLGANDQASCHGPLACASCTRQRVDKWARGALGPCWGTIDHDGIAAAGRIDAVIHLAGEGLAEHRWSQAQKAKILESRIHGTRLLASTMASLDSPPAVFLSGSAIGFYGDRGNEKLTEESAPGLGFASEVVQAWEASTDPLDQRTRVTHLRTGIVLDPSAGRSRNSCPFSRAGSAVASATAPNG